MKILMIGNSYTYYHDMPRLLESLLRENGLDAQVYSVTKGGRKLIEYTTKEDEYSQQLTELAQNHTFDFVFLQEQSLLSILNYDLFLSGVTALAEQLRPCTKDFVLYATWGRKDGSPDLETHGLSRLSMTEQISAAYHRAAHSIQAAVSPVGSAFSALYDELDLYDPDCSHPSLMGSCLAALTHYTMLVGALPAKFASLPVPTEVASSMAKTVSSLCCKA